MEQARGSRRRRIIPARAGPTSFPFLWWSGSSDHPRSCGANLAIRWDKTIVDGSSPLVRGQLSSPLRDRCTCRIIPARAGPTVHIVVPDSNTPDHPRSCGANGIAVADSEFVGGSSPLVRGQPARASRLARNTRIIPARAGPTVHDTLPRR